MGRHSSEVGVGVDWRADRVGTARRGENPMVLARMRSGWAVIGDTQFLPGYCILLADADGVDHLTDLPRPARAELLADIGLLGEAVMTACNGLDPFLRRLDYEIRDLRGHVYPRYGWEPGELVDGPVWGYPADRWTSPRDAFGEEHEPLREAITLALHRVMSDAYAPLA